MACGVEQYVSRNFDNIALSFGSSLSPAFVARLKRSAQIFRLVRLMTDDRVLYEYDAHHWTSRSE